MKIIRISENSGKYEWELNDEIFDFLSKRFDVRKAKEIINNTPPRKIMNMGLSGVASMVPRKSIQKNKDGSREIVSGINIDWNKIDNAESNIDLAFPVIVATIGNSHLPIDGWHRIAMAVDKGINSLPAILLTEEETDRVKIR